MLNEKPQVTPGGPILGTHKLPDDLVAAVHGQYLRRDIGYALPGLIVEQARQRPEKAPPFTFPGHLVDLHSAAGSGTTWFDLASRSGWGDRPVGDFALEGAASPQELAAEFGRRLARGDADGLVLLYDPDAVLVTAPDNVARGRDQIRALARTIDDGIAIDLEPKTIHVAGDQALVAEKAVVRTPAGVRTAMSAAVCRRRADGRWFYLVDDPTFIRTASQLMSTETVDAAATATGA